MKVILICYLFGYILAFISLLKLRARSNKQLVVNDLFLGALVACTSWIGFIFLDDVVGNLIQKLLEFGDKPIWKKKDT